MQAQNHQNATFQRPKGEKMNSQTNSERRPGEAADPGQDTSDFVEEPARTLWSDAKESACSKLNGQKDVVWPLRVALDWAGVPL